MHFDSFWFCLFWWKISRYFKAVGRFWQSKNTISFPLHNSKLHRRATVHNVMKWILRRPLTCRAPLVFMFFDCRHPRFRYFGSVVPIDVVRVQSYVNSLFHFSRVPVVVCINKLNFFLQQLMSGFVSVFWEGGTLGACETQYLCRVLSFFHSFLHGSSCFTDVDLGLRKTPYTETIAGSKRANHSRRPTPYIMLYRTQSTPSPEEDWQ